MSSDLMKLEQPAQDMLAALYEVEDYLDDRADAYYDQDGYVPNKEMTLLSVVRAAIAKAEGRDA